MLLLLLLFWTRYSLLLLLGHLLAGALLAARGPGHLAIHAASIRWSRRFEVEAASNIVDPRDLVNFGGDVTILHTHDAYVYTWGYGGYGFKLGLTRSPTSLPLV